MRKRTIRGALAVLSILLPTLARADNDFHLWMESGIKYKINKRFRFDASQILKLDENASHLENTDTELAVNYKVTKFFSLKGGYRLIVEPNARKGRTDIDLWHRFFIDAKLAPKIDPLTLEYRFRYMQEFAWLNNKSGFTTRQTLRNKAGISCDVGKGFSPFVNGELFVRIGDQDGILHKWRASAGLDYEYKASELSLYYLAEGRFNKPGAPLGHILGMSYFYIF